MSSLMQSACEGLDTELRSAERVLHRAERCIRLIDRLIPIQFESERHRLERAVLSGQPAEPRFQYVAAPEMPRILAELRLLAETLERRGSALALFFAERARELGLEAELVMAIGTRSFGRLARQRYRPDSLHSKREVEAWVEESLAAPRAELSAERIRSDDARDPRSLYSRLVQQIGQNRWPIRVEVRRELWSLAAAGDGFVAIRAGAWLTEREAARVACHELLAHAGPRVAAQREVCGILRVGARDSGEEEEGRALWLEERAGYWDSSRRRALALRHRAATLARAGANLAELMQSLLLLDETREQAFELALRMLRGGGLCREIVYLPAYLRVRSAFDAEPTLQAIFERGRASLSFARWLSSQAQAASAIVSDGEAEDVPLVVRAVQAL